MDEFSVLTGLEVEQIRVWASTLRLVFAFRARGRDDIHLDPTDFRFTDAANESRDNGAHLTCPPQTAYEAWAACLPSGCWYCPPGGGSDTGWRHP